MQIRLTILLIAVLGAGLAFAAETPRRGDLTPEDYQRVLTVTAPTSDFSKPEKFEQLPAGAATTRKIVNRDAFSFSSANLSFEEEGSFKLGNALFRKLWVSSPSSTQTSDGLGPLFNARGCQNCHLKDGRGHPPEAADDQAVSMFLRLSVPPENADEQTLLDSRGVLLFPEPTYGEQLQVFAVPGLKAEGRMVIDYADLPVTMADGTVVTLRSPTYSVADLAYGQMSDKVMISPRVAPPMIGLGLLEAIAPEDILDGADPDDADGDGISGKPNWVKDLKSGELMLGRFGWKAGAPSIRVQSASAFSGDIGIATPLVNRPYGDCTAAEAECLAMPNGEQLERGISEAPDPVLDLVTFYSQNLGVPQRRDIDKPEVLAGKAAFYSAGCISCHTPKYVTSRQAEGKAQKFQLIWPYTDMLLHDMGEGLADYRPEGAADGYEWRTPPLWGIGLTETVSGHTLFLHDGRARNLTEAILWHGGEAEKSRQAFMQMSKTQRDSVIAFLESL
ncbi:MAG TPA: di-heme oxidoredictase family protein [Devosia sp.]|nr:di-heme oxidoredictase family protein [Devosia sp.]